MNDDRNQRPDVIVRLSFFFSVGQRNGHRAGSELHLAKTAPVKVSIPDAELRMQPEELQRRNHATQKSETYDRHQQYLGSYFHIAFDGWNMPALVSDGDFRLNARSIIF